MRTHAAAHAGKQGLTNIRVAQVNAPELFKVTTAGTVAEVWTFFPDPWPKKKHHKRRIVQKAMAGDIHRALVTDGVWRIATDIEDYALHVHEVMDGLDGWKNLGSVTVSLPRTWARAMPTWPPICRTPTSPNPSDSRRVLTNFEKKGLAAGRMIHDFTYQAVT